MNIEDVFYILDLFPDAEIVIEADGTYKIRRLGKLVTRVRPDGTLFLAPADRPSKRPQC